MKKILTGILLTILCFSFTACAKPVSPSEPEVSIVSEEDTPDAAEEGTDENAEATTEEEAEYTKDFGTYRVSANWVENDTYSSQGKYFYFPEGVDAQAQTKANNISIHQGTNKYALEDHMQFKTAITSQLAQQVPKDVLVNGYGFTSENGDIVYAFEIDDPSGIKTTQYYIVGDYKFILVHETTWDDATEEADAVAKAMVESFTWAE